MNAVITSYSPGALLGLAATTTTVPVVGARIGMAAYATPSADPGSVVFWTAWVSANDVVTLRLFSLTALTPNTRDWNVRVIP